LGPCVVARKGVVKARSSRMIRSVKCNAVREDLHRRVRTRNGGVAI